MHWLNTLQMHNFHQTELRLQQQQATQAQATDTQTTQTDQQASNDDLQAGDDDLQATSISSLVEEKIGIIGSTVGGESVKTVEEKLTTL